MRFFHVLGVHGFEETATLNLEFPLRHRPLLLEVNERLNDELGDGEARVPLAVGGHDVPRGMFRRRAIEHYLVGLLVGVPLAARVDVVRRVFPPLIPAREALGQAHALLAMRMHERDLDEGVAFLDEFRLPAVDLVVALVDLVLVGELIDAANENVLVVRTVEHADLARRRQLLLDAP